MLITIVVSRNEQEELPLCGDAYCCAKEKVPSLVFSVALIDSITALSVLLISAVWLIRNCAFN